ncbi:ribosome small subunit-dependent GTPase [Paenibacillus aceti]|uniref:Small ribosomal subunit biogenesis GTPase RsgA n=2 Tax=Paenibacillus aceti TaxID=1820010 RepID=A0ABQ1VUW3_9BACL|nr:ribosome small subunit-dependent GTPase [Paenibacillus aceti]
MAMRRNDLTVSWSVQGNTKGEYIIKMEYESLKAFGWTADWQPKWLSVAEKYDGDRLKEGGYGAEVADGVHGFNGAARADGIEPARIVADYGQKYEIRSERGTSWAALSGKARLRCKEQRSYPGVGDWVAVKMMNEGDDAVIHEVLERKSLIVRQAAGFETKEQVIAANVDTLFIVCALNHDFNVRRIERYLIMAWNSGVNPVIVLSKSDLCEDVPSYVAETEMIAPGVPIISVSAHLGIGRERLEAYVSPGTTIALAGSSGSGKSTLINWLTGAEIQLTQEVREEDSRGRHTTTHRELFLLPQGGVLIDTPGMRELSIWDNDGGLERTFEDIEHLKEDCLFSDCQHRREKGCAVLQAVQDGTLDQKRLDNYHKMQREIQFQMRKERIAAKKNASRSSTGPKSGQRDRRGWRREIEE